jgi:hypothetical protein
MVFVKKDVAHLPLIEAVENNHGAEWACESNSDVGFLRLSSAARMATKSRSLAARAVGLNRPGLSTIPNFPSVAHGPR